MPLLWQRHGFPMFDPALLTAYERDALRQARGTFAEALEACGVMEPFFEKPAEVIDRIMLAAIEGYRIAMEKKCGFSDEVPM